MTSTGTKTLNPPKELLLPPRYLREEYGMIMDRFLRNFSFLNQEILDRECDHVSSLVGISAEMVRRAITCFLASVKHFHSKKTDAWEANKEKRITSLKSKLETIHRFAPVFNLSRSKSNTSILQDVLEACNVFPTSSSQLALILFATDLKSITARTYKPLIQKNIQLIANCSPYAFHRNRNMIEAKFPTLFLEDKR